MRTLYDFELSAECYRVRLLLAFLGLRYDVVPVDIFPGADHNADWFRAINPLGTLPVLSDAGNNLVSPLGILGYLARQYDSTRHWYPPEAAEEVDAFVVIAGELDQTAGAARLELNFGQGEDLATAQGGAHQIMRRLDEHLWFGERAGRDWFCAPQHPTLADLACFPPIVLSEEGGVSRQDYPAIRRWLDRFKRISGFVPMSGVFPAAPAK
jgi:glutathione S-transferase